MVSKQAAASSFNVRPEVSRSRVCGEQRPVKHAVSSFGSREAPAEKGKWAPLTSLQLFQNCAKADVQGIRVNGQRGVQAGVSQQAVSTKDILDVEERPICFRRPREGRVELAGNHLMKWKQDCSGIRDEVVTALQQT